MQHLPPLISDLALILGSAAVFSLLFKILKQPVVLGYLLAGLVVGPNFNFFPTVVEAEGIKVWAEIGVIFLLFGLGLEFSFKKLMRIGPVAGITAVIEVLLTMLSGYLLGQFLGWSAMDSLFFGGVLAIASTTIIIRSFDELGVKSKGFASLVTGILVFEDLVAVVLMVVLSTVSVSRAFEGTEMALSIFKLIFFLIIWFVSGIFFLPSFLRWSKRYLSEEMLLIVSLALCLLMVFLAYKAGFSPALGAFIMGSILAETSKAERIEHLIHPIKNLFGAIFFVSVGMLIDVHMITEHYIPVLLGVLLLVFAKPFFVITGALITGQSLRTSVQTGMSMSQIGEFSFIIASLGLSLGVISEHLYPVAVAISVITTFTTPFMIKYSEPATDLLERLLPKSWLAALLRYSTGAQKVSEVSEWRRYIQRSLLNMLVFSVIIFFIILFGGKYMSRMVEADLINRITIMLIILTAISPFLWALSFKGTRISWIRQLKPIQRGPINVLLASRVLLSLFFLGFLFDVFFSPLIAFMGVLLTLIPLFFFRSRIQSYYYRIEKRFLINLNERDSKEQSSAKILAPWDSHMATFEMVPELSLLGKPLQHLLLRETYGINIAFIKRGEKTINVPGKNDILYPGDIVAFIGTDHQLQKFKEFIDADLAAFPEPEEEHPVSLEHFTIKENSSFSGVSIRDSAIRERTKGLVVGIERNGQRILNPESDFVLQTNDTVWLVGDAMRIKVLLKNL